MRFIRECKICFEDYRPTGKYGRMCGKCSKKSRMNSGKKRRK